MVQREDGRRGNAEQGFTLIELMVVVLVIAILLAIAVPTYLGARNSAHDEAAQTSLHITVLAARAAFAEGQSYDNATFADALQAVEPSLTFVRHNVPSTDPKTVSVKATDTNVWYGAAYSKSGTCFYIRDSVASGDAGTTYAEATPAECDGNWAHGKPNNQYKKKKKRG
jgi:type IV pilus assembly protein PilA